jgi:hypothetical protein
VSDALVIEVETAPIDRARADLAIVCFASTDRPLRGAAGRADWRLCGRLSRLIAAGRIAGHAGEAVLLPGGGGLRAPRVLALGLGPGSSLGPAAAAALARDAMGRGLALRAAVIALGLPVGELGDLALRLRLEAIVTGAGDALAARRAGATASLVLVSEREDGPRVLDALRGVRPPGFPRSVALRLPGAPVRRAAALPASPRGEAGLRPSPFK